MSISHVQKAWPIHGEVLNTYVLLYGQRGGERRGEEKTSKFETNSHNNLSAQMGHHFCYKGIKMASKIARTEYTEC